MDVVTINYQAALLNTVNLRLCKRKHTQLEEEKRERIVEFMILINSMQSKAKIYCFKNSRSYC